MGRLAVQLALLVVLSGTPLRQAEAASDFARSAAEWLQAGSIEEPDGGVGDDSGVSVGTSDAPGQLADALRAAGSYGLIAPTPPPALRGLTPAEAADYRARVARPQAPPGSRHAWLQVFRF